MDCSARMNASANYTLMTDADGEGTGASSITARNSIALQGIQPAETNPVVHSDSNGGDSSCEDSPDAVMRSPKRSILKRAQRTPTENSENNSRSRISSNRVLFCDKSPGKLHSDIYFFNYTEIIQVMLLNKN